MVWHNVEWNPSLKRLFAAKKGLKKAIIFLIFHVRINEENSIASIPNISSIANRQFHSCFTKFLDAKVIQQLSARGEVLAN